MNGPAASPFPWRAVMALGLGRLAWPPDTFWSATPCEILAAAGAFGAGEAVAPPRRSELDRLMRAYPDQRAGSHPIDHPGGWT